MQRRGVFTICSIAVLWAAIVVSARAQPIEEEIVASTQILAFKGRQVGQPVDGLVFEGGIDMQSGSDLFGGLSSIAFVGPSARFAMVSDIGNFVSGQILYDEAGRPFTLVGVQIDPIRNSKGAELPRKFAKDAEALDTVYRDGAAVAVRVGFENLSRVADYALVDGRPGGPAKELAIPQWLTDARSNEDIESVCVAPSTSPVAGSTLVIAENIRDDAYNHRATLLGNKDKGDLVLAPIPDVNPTDCAFLPNGDLLVLERGIAFLSFTMRLRHIPAAEVRPGATMAGTVILSASGSDIDNMEGVASHPGPDGKTRITLISDNNFNDWERNLLLEFSLPE